MNETTWDGNATFWDVDLAGPGTRTIWDVLPDFLAISGIARILPAHWIARLR